MIDRAVRSGAAFWVLLFGVTWALSSYSFQLYKALDARWIIRFPKKWELPLEDWISDFLDWLVESAGFFFFSFKDLTRAIAAAIEAPYQALRNLLIEGFQSGLGDTAVEIAPSLSWIAVIVTVAAIGHYARDWALAALVGACFAYLAVFGQWESAMITLASVLIAVPIGAVGGLALGIGAYRAPWFDRLLRPVSRSDADRAGLCLSGADPHSLRFRPRRGADRHRDLCHAAHGAGDDRGAPRRTAGDRRGGPHGRLHATPVDVEGAGPLLQPRRSWSESTRSLC